MTRAYCLSLPRGDSPVPPFFGSGRFALIASFWLGALALTAFLWLGAAHPCCISLPLGGSHSPPPFGSGRLALTALLWLGATCPYRLEHSSNGSERSVASKNTRAITSNAQWPQRTLEQWLRALSGLKEHSSNTFECSVASKNTRAMVASAQWP